MKIDFVISATRLNLIGSAAFLLDWPDIWKQAYPAQLFGLCATQWSSVSPKWPAVYSANSEAYLWYLTKIAGLLVEAHWTVQWCHFSLTEPSRQEPQLSGQLNSLRPSRCCPNLLRLAAYVAHLLVLTPSVCLPARTKSAVDLRCFSNQTLDMMKLVSTGSRWPTCLDLDNHKENQPLHFLAESSRCFDWMQVYWVTVCLQLPRTLIHSRGFFSSPVYT